MPQEQLGLAPQTYLQALLAEDAGQRLLHNTRFLLQ
jgi:hypothetical protein